ncbi:MAG: phosphomannomutase/phosphoglucomutase [Alphaproteobacteria bacterium]|nr:phosphomannomutase/phosphoglucomutase [Alphaproteobacteria bacterium]
MQGHRFHPTILRAYDVRGIVGETLGEADARALGRAFGTTVVRRGGRSVCVGYDGRLSSPALEAALVEGLAATGLAVRRIGLGPTPMLYFSVHQTAADAGVMVTGSHNPPTHNGFKFMLGQGVFFGDDIAALGGLARAGDFVSGNGTIAPHEVKAAYIARLVNGLDLPAAAIVWDAGNGAAGAVLAEVTARLPGRHVLLNDRVDGTFPAHHPDPTVEANLAQLRQAVADKRADLGIAFDGDGDRIGVIDGRGRVLWGDQLLALLARDVLADNPGATVIGDVKSSVVLFDEIRRLGGKPIVWMTGHSLIKSKMKETHALLAGEMSAHIFFADQYYGYDDALYAGLRLLQTLKRSGRSMAELLDQLPKMVNTPELRFDCTEERKFEVVGEVRDRLRAAGAEVLDIDGVRVTTPDGWWLLRASNTQAVLVARCEAKSADGLGRLKTQLTEQLSRSGIDLPM